MRSMTGFGQATWQSGGKRLSVEVRSVNQRFLDVKLSLPRECQAWEVELRELVSGVAERGKVDVTIYRAGNAGDDFTVEANEPLARAILAGWQGLQRHLKLPGAIDIGMLMGRGTDLVRVVERRADASADLPQVKRLLVAALKDFNRTRDREGKLLQADMQSRLKRMRAIYAALHKRTAALVPELARRLSERVGALLGKGTVSEERLVQEARPARRALRRHRGAGPPRQPPRPPRRAAAPEGLGGQGDRLPHPGDPPRGEHHRLEERRPRGDQPDPRGQERDREAARAGAERGVEPKNSTRRRRDAEVRRAPPSDLRVSAPLR